MERGRSFTVYLDAEAVAVLDDYMEDESIKAYNAALNRLIKQALNSDKKKNILT